MFYTVFSTNTSPRMQWQSELLEYSWKRAGQEGALVRLVATDKPDRLPGQKYAQCVATRLWDVHPETGDNYPIYNKPASLLEWLFRDRPEGTVLLIDPDCVFRKPVTRHVAPGFPVAQDWINLRLRKPSGSHPFGLPPGFSFFLDSCARVDLTTAPVMIPTLIHTDDLRRICARWLELTGIVRQYARNNKGQPIWEADMYAYVAACAEYGLHHDPMPLGVCTNWRPRDAPDAPIIHYCQVVLDKDGRELFGKFSYRPWTRIDTTSEPEFEYGRDLVSIINAHADEANREAGRVTFDRRPRRRAGVMEGRVMDEMLLEVPADGGSVWLNISGKAAWELFDGVRSIDQIQAELGQRFSANGRDVAADVLSLVEELHRFGFLELG
jgi:hypothetical protein